MKYYKSDLPYTSIEHYFDNLDVIYDLLDNEDFAREIICKPLNQHSERFDLVSLSKTGTVDWYWIGILCSSSTEKCLSFPDPENIEISVSYAKAGDKVEKPTKIIEAKFYKTPSYGEQE